MRAVVLPTSVGADAQLVPPSVLGDDEDAKRNFLFFAARWNVRLQPRCAQPVIAYAAHRFEDIRRIVDHARAHGRADEPLPEANLHTVLLFQMTDVSHGHPEYRAFVDRVMHLAAQPECYRIGPRIEEAFRSSNGFEPPARLGEMFCFLTAYICSLSLYPGLESSEAFRSLVSLYRSGNILFRIDETVIHNLCLAD